MKRIGLLPRIIIAIALGIALGQVMPMGGVRLFATFNTIFALSATACPQGMTVVESVSLQAPNVATTKS